MPNTEEHMGTLGHLCAELTDQLEVYPQINFAGVFWNKGQAEDSLGVAIFSKPETQAEAPYAAITAAVATMGAASGLELHGLDTPDRVCFYEQDFYVLSNFSAFGIEWRGRIFPTVEHAYHFEKFYGGGPSDRLIPGLASGDVRARPTALDIHNCLSAHNAFKLAQERRAIRRPDWDAIKIGVMQQLLFVKCEQHEYVKRKLLATGDRLLVENSWRDSFWGWGPERTGENMLGRLWMATRTFYRKQGAMGAEDAGSRL